MKTIPVWQLIGLTRKELKEVIVGIIRDWRNAHAHARNLLQFHGQRFLRIRVRRVRMSKADMDQVWFQWGREDRKKGLDNGESVPKCFRRAYERGLEQ